jgi:hypothetical protein
MKTLISITAITSGILLILVPRYILPACEYEGFPRMHCSDTAQAEFLAGGIFILVGILAMFMRSANAQIASAAAGCIIALIAFLLPERYGYCHSSKMPCNYGMVPGIRFIAITAIATLSIAIIGIIRSSRKKGQA